MDNLTHTLVGVAMGEAGLRRRYGSGTTLLLAVASNVPDLDVMLSIVVGEDGFLLRRMFTHSVLGAPVLAALLAAAWARWKTQQRFVTWLGIALLGVVVHVFLDLVNSYGVVWLWPFSGDRFELAWVFIIDLVLWGLLIAPLLLRVTPLKRRVSPVTLHRVFLAAVAAWVAACALGRWRAQVLFDDALARAGASPEFRYVFPEPLGPHRWRGVARKGDTWSLHLVEVLPGRVSEHSRRPTDAFDPRVRALRSTPAVERLEWFFKAPVWTILEDGERVRVEDLRFRSLVLEREGAPFSRVLALPKTD